MTSKKNFVSTMETWASIYLFQSLTQYFDYLRTTEVSMQQAYALTFIYYNSPSKISAICEHMMVSVAAASQMVDRLEKLNFVKRTTEPGDRRVRNVVLSEQGESFVSQSIAARQSWVKNLPTDLSDEQLDQISAALEILISRYQE